MGFSFFNVEAGVRAEVLASGGHGAVPPEFYKFRTAKGEKIILEARDGVDIFRRAM